MVGKDYSSKLEAQQLGKGTSGGRNIAAITVVFIQRSLHVHSGCLVSPKNKRLVKLFSFTVVIWEDLGHFTENLAQDLLSTLFLQNNIFLPLFQTAMLSPPNVF